MADDNSIDGGTFGSPDSSLDDWLKNPEAADFIKQKAIEHAQALLSYSDDQAGLSSGHPPLGGPLPNDPGMDTTATPPTAAVPPLPQSVPPTSIFGRAKTAFGSPDPTADQGPVTINPSGVRPATDVPLPISDPRKSYLDPDDPTIPPAPVAESIPLPRERPKEAGPGASDISAKKKTSAADAIGEFGKTLAAVKPTPPPANPAVGTPSVRTTTAIPNQNISQLLALLGSQSKPSAIDTLGRLLVAGKA